MINSLAPGGYGFDLKCVILKCAVVITFMSIFTFRPMKHDPTDD